MVPYVSSRSLAMQMIVVSMIALQRRDVRHKEADNSEPFLSVYDYIVVGGGTAGCVVARRLSDNKRVSVLLLEAGGPQISMMDIPGIVPTLLRDNPQFNWNYTISPQKRILRGRARPGVYAEPKGRVLGGSSSINGMVFLRGNRRDFDNWEQIYGATDWGFRDVLPYFIEMENNSDHRIVAQNPGFHGTNGPMGVSSAPNRNAFLRKVQKSYNKFRIPTIDLNGPEQVGTAFIQINTENGFRESTANAYLEPNPNPTNLFISLNSLVTRIFFSKTGGKPIASGVELRKNGRDFKVRAKREVILCSGSYNSPQILMLSGIGPRKHLKKLGISSLVHLPVGYNLQDHLRITFQSIISNNTKLEPFPQLNDQQLSQLVNEQRGPLATYTGLYTYLSTSSCEDPEWPNIVISNRIAKFSTSIRNLTSVYSSQRSEEWAQYYRPYLGQPYLVSDILLRRPRSRGRVRLTSKNATVLPKIDPNFLQIQQDLDDLVEGIKFELFFIQNSRISKNVRLIPKAIPGCSLCRNRPIYECDSYIRCYIREVGSKEHHSCGTCRMGALNRKDTVVDPRLRVKNVSQLRVCDASVMPEIPNTNTLAATVMIGEKCASYIKQEDSL